MALARALIDELDRIVPMPGSNAVADDVDHEAHDELRRLAVRVLALTGTMIRTPAGLVGLDSASQRRRVDEPFDRGGPDHAP